MGLAHLHIQSKAVRDAVAFYTTYMDLKEVQFRDDGGALLIDGRGLAFFIDDTPDRPDIPDSIHIGFRLETPEDVRSRYEQVVKDLPVVDDLQEEDGFSVFSVRDPDGMMVEVYYSAL